MFQPKWQFNAHKDASNSTNSQTSGDVERGTPFNRDSDSSKLGQLIGSLPHELLAEVFSWCCPTYENRNFRVPPYSVLDLSHVCSYWREVALHSPHLWTHLRLAVDSYYIGCLDKPSQLLKLWLSHAQNCPLVVDIDFHEHPRLQSPENILRSVKSFISTAVENKASIASESMELRAALVTTASRGVRFHCVSEKYSWANPSACSDRPFPGSVQININKCANIVYGLEGHVNLGPYLTHLDLRDTYNHVLFSVEECQIVLSNFPRLEHCAMRLGRSAGADVETINTLYSLRTLFLVWQGRCGYCTSARLDHCTRITTT
ncbi:hypothetical protein DFH11DRAFT_1076912 [Phellopilus nigrolimitatus]|nr:hypothetical protein DFH11DRAFT_1076912 [Phellopilus nigrolimitatus]